MSDINIIKKSIGKHLEDLHILFIDYGTTLDIEYYNKVREALVKAGQEIKIATSEHKARVETFKRTYKIYNPE